MNDSPFVISAARLLSLGLVLALAGCDDDGPSSPPSVSGVVTARLVSPNGPEGAAMIEVEAEPVENVTADSADVFAVTVGDRTRIVVVRAEPGEIRALLALRDTSAELDPAVLEVADSTNALRKSLAGYRVEVVP